MLLNDLNIKQSYRSNLDSMINDFYNPVLSTAKSYKRAVGYFTLSSLINVSQGLTNLIENGGTVKIIASPKLSVEDINTIELGYKMKYDVMLDAMIREVSNIKSEEQKEKLNYIATLIADNRLDIKIAVMNEYGAYHEKFGLISDGSDNKILFTGSMNETNNGQNINFESFVVFKSWNVEQKQYIDEYEENFEKLWNNKTQKLSVESFPEALKNKILEYKKPTYDKESNGFENLPVDELELTPKYPKMPEWFEPRDYQNEAIDKWKKNNFKGLLSMATGTGKTLTGLYGLTCLWNEIPKLVSIIVCPYQHLVEQWVEDVKKFNINPVVCYSKYVNWKNSVYRKIKLINFGTIDNFTIVTTNATFVTNEMQKLIDMLNCPILLIIDEAHNAGTDTMKKCLSDKFKYRLGLSATPRRFRDEESTNFIYNFFGGEVFSFDLKTAIEKNFLTRYYYYPHTINLNEEEQEKYNELSLKIAQNIKEENGKLIINDIAKNLLIKRARLVAGASNKLNLLRNLMQNYKDKNYILVYCGAAKTLDETEMIEERQIEKVCKILGNEFDMRIHKFTADESSEERENIIKMFSNGQTLQAIVAIKCLDEGVNIPAIQHAFIMASSTDPKEFIQRRGRVLRKYDGKKYAYIHDFITLPLNQYSDKINNLVETELKRVYEFNSLAENKLENNDLIDELVSNYKIPYENIVNAIDKYNVGEDYE